MPCSFLIPQLGKELSALIDMNRFRLFCSGCEIDPISVWKPMFLPNESMSFISDAFKFLYISSSVNNGVVSPGFLSKKEASLSMPYFGI